MVPSPAGTVPAMSWVEFDDAVLGHVVLELQPTVVEVFGARRSETERIHLRLLRVQHLGPDDAGNQRVELGRAGGTGVTLTVPGHQWDRVWPWVEQVRGTQASWGFPPPS